MNVVIGKNTSFFYESKKLDDYISDIQETNSNK